MGEEGKLVRLKTDSTELAWEETGDLRLARRLRPPWYSVSAHCNGCRSGRCQDFGERPKGRVFRRLSLAEPSLRNWTESALRRASPLSLPLEC
jgi:hypothetical protein